MTFLSVLFVPRELNLVMRSNNVINFGINSAWKQHCTNH